MADVTSLGALRATGHGWPPWPRTATPARRPARHAAAQRAMDVALCVLLLPGAAAVLLACVVALWLESAGPVFESQQCVGRGGRPFRRFRLRTGTRVDRAGPAHRQRAVAPDDGCTRVGRVLRCTGLAELPQLLNVLKGEMSLVGPRAALAGPSTARLWHTERLEVRPGIVSIAHVRGGAALGAEEGLRLEIGYVRHASVALDAGILAEAGAIAIRRGWRLAWQGGAGGMAVPVTVVAAPARTLVRPRASVGARRLADYWAARGALIVAADAGVIVGALLLSYHVRFALGLALPGSVAGVTASTADLLLYLKSACILAVVWIYGLQREGAYHGGLAGSTAPTVRFAAIASSGLVALAAVMAIGFMYRDLLLSRQVYAVGAVLAAGGVAGVRAVFGLLDRVVATRGATASRVLIVGTSSSARDFAETLRREAPAMRVVGHLADEEADAAAGPAVLGGVGDVAAVHERVPFDTLVLASPRLCASAMEGAVEGMVRLVNFCEEHAISLYMLSGSFSVTVMPTELASFSGRPLIRLQDAPPHPLYGLVKRAADVVAAAALLVLGLPIWVAVAALVRLTSPGPLLFTQWRAGQHGRPFRMYKFRSMTADAEDRLAELVDLTRLDEPVFKIRDDPRVTPVGRWMRRTGVDEIPQLLNVLKGEMSIVGPRPEEIRLVEQYTSWQRRRLKAKPGITGYQQIRNRGGTSLAERVEYDLVYLKHQSLLLDLYILCRTPAVIIRGSGISH